MSYNKLVISPITKGWNERVLPFHIDNDAFPVINNFYTWRGRVKRKRGTLSLQRLQKVVSISATPRPWEVASFNLVAGAVNLITSSALEATASITPGTINLVIGANTYTDLNQDGILVGVPGGSGTINYRTGDMTIAGGGNDPIVGTFAYYPTLPVMGLRDFLIPTSTIPRLVAFDTKYSYQITSDSSNFYNTNFFKSPTGIDTNTPFSWSGLDSDQFWTINFQNALWTTNGTPGFHFLGANITNITPVGGAPTTELQITVVNPSVVVDDYIYINEITETVVAGDLSLNGVSGKVLSATAGTINIEVPSGTYNVYAMGGGGVVQLLTRNVTGDGIRWYDGDPTASDGEPSGTGKGWVNFAPPLFSIGPVSINDSPFANYYLVGAKLIFPFKDRLVFFAPYIQAFGQASPILLHDTIIFSWNGTAYYAAPVPDNQSFDTSAYYIDVTGKGGWLSAGNNQQITSVSPDQDVLIVGFPAQQTRLVFTQNNLFPYTFYSIDEELGVDSTFTTTHLPIGTISYGRNGFTLTNQNKTERIDIEIPFRSFRLKGSTQDLNAKRLSSSRDFYHEWIDFTWVPTNSLCDFPTKTIKFNYREGSWSYHDENFTAQGGFRRQTGYTWANNPFGTWAQTTSTWASSQTTSLFPNVIGGTPQGFVLIKGIGTTEAPSKAVSAMSDNNGFYQLTSKDHCFEEDDYVYFTNFLGETTLNTQTAKISIVIDDDNIVLDIPVPDLFDPNSYLGLGLITPLPRPFIQTKQFAPFWEQGRKVRLGSQAYLLDRTSAGEVTALIYLNQDPGNAWNDTVIVPDVDSTNDGLIYSTLVYTSPESTNLGLTPANVNLQMPTASSQFQIWHRMNSSLIGDSFQVGITLSDAQMRDFALATDEITISGFEFNISTGPLVA